MSEDSPYLPDEIDENGMPNFPLIVARAGHAARMNGDPREIPEMWAKSSYFVFWFVGYDL